MSIKDLGREATCDFCQKTVNVCSSMIFPEAWSRLKVLHCSSQVGAFDLCDECWPTNILKRHEKPFRKSFTGKLIEFFKQGCQS